MISSAPGRMAPLAHRTRLSIRSWRGKWRVVYVQKRKGIREGGNIAKAKALRSGTAKHKYSGTSIAKTRVFLET